MRNCSLSCSVGTRPNFSSTLSLSNMPAPAYAMTPRPMKMRVFGVMFLYHLHERSVQAEMTGHLGCILPDSHDGVVVRWCGGGAEVQGFVEIRG